MMHYIKEQNLYFSGIIMHNTELKENYEEVYRIHEDGNLWPCVKKDL
jgi:hypothetical protein